MVDTRTLGPSSLAEPPTWRATAKRPCPEGHSCSCCLSTAEGKMKASQKRVRVWACTHGAKATAVLVVVFLIAEVLIGTAGETAGPKEGYPDATAFISALILTYTVFIAIYGALLPLILATRRGDWKLLSVVLIVTAVGVNLWRVQNSIGDLYQTTLRKLDADRIHDASYEFVNYYFYSNALIMGILLSVVGLQQQHHHGT